MGCFKYKEVVETARRLACPESSPGERSSRDGLEERARFTHRCHAGEPGRGPGKGALRGLTPREEAAAHVQATPPAGMCPGETRELLEDRGSQVFPDT